MLFIESIICFDTHKHHIYFYISVPVVTMMSDNEYDYVSKRRSTKVRWQVGDHVNLR